MKLIVVTAPTFFVEEDKIITALFEEGLDILHLRKPETPAMYSERLLTLIPEKYHRRIVTHEHFYLKEEFDLMGIHLNTRNPHEPHDYSGHVSYTCHSVEEVKSKKHFYDYVFMSPVYDCISKEGILSGYTPEELMIAKELAVAAFDQPRHRFCDSADLDVGSIAVKTSFFSISESTKGLMRMRYILQ